MGLQHLVTFVFSVLVLFYFLENILCISYECFQV